MCDTPLCVNPDHLFLGSHQDNMRDMVVKKRSFVGRGEDKKGRAKLTNQQADQIRKMEISQSKIAALFGVSQTTIGRIKRGESY
jgi:predicted XRE-type DNA-binding protein